MQKTGSSKKLTFLASTCNSIIIEIYGDIIRVSHGFDGCQLLEYIAGTLNSTFRIANLDATGFILQRNVCYSAVNIELKNLRVGQEPYPVQRV
jgi:hypothetical protein